MGQSMSFGLTQFDVDELIAFSKGACECERCEGALLRRHEACQVLTKLAELPPRTYDFPRAPAVTQQEIEALYKRFKSLDRGRKVLPRRLADVLGGLSGSHAWLPCLP